MTDKEDPPPQEVDPPFTGEVYPSKGVYMNIPDIPSDSIYTFQTYLGVIMVAFPIWLWTREKSDPAVPHVTVVRWGIARPIFQKTAEKKVKPLLKILLSLCLVVIGVIIGFDGYKSWLKLENQQHTNQQTEQTSNEAKFDH